jgi:GNAT superfamily N-acetyltransferase
MMLVAQEHRGRGVGKQLMRTALDHCGRSGIARSNSMQLLPAETISRLRVRAVNVGDISLHCLPNGLFATTRRGSGSSPVGIHYGSARSASSCRNGLFWTCRECAETCT